MHHKYPRVYTATGHHVPTDMVAGIPPLLALLCPPIPRLPPTCTCTSTAYLNHVSVTMSERGLRHGLRHGLPRVRPYSPRSVY